MLTFLVSAIRLGMTFLLGSTGETITEKSGHLNLGVPGIMCVGASCGCFVEAVYLSTVPVRQEIPLLAVLLPILAALIGGALMGLLFSFFTVTLRANQNVTGLAITTLGIGISNYIIDKADDYGRFARATKHFTAPLVGEEVVEWFEEIGLGWFGELFLSYGIFVWLALAIAIGTSLVFNRTRVGLHLRAVGENPATADAAGINVTRYRYVATCIGCAIVGLGGLSFIMDYLNGQWEYCVDTIGWLAVALVIFTLWRPILAIFGSIVFGALYIASSRLTTLGVEMTLADKELFRMLPFAVTILVLVVTSIFSKKNQPPAGLGLPYFREER
ncbi:MAG: ABC transporter permease [Ruminococcaceae bacterium]|nr:ABC transporter permease [Oscillospiraceae bacterium]